MIIMYCECKPKWVAFASKLRFLLDLSKCWLIVDRWKDIDAGQNVGCKTIFIDHNYIERKPQNLHMQSKNSIKSPIIISNIR